MDRQLRLALWTPSTEATMSSCRIQPIRLTILDFRLARTAQLDRYLALQFPKLTVCDREELLSELSLTCISTLRLPPDLVAAIATGAQRWEARLFGLLRLVLFRLARRYWEASRREVLVGSDE